MDACESLMCRAQYAVAVVGNRSTDDFELIDLPMKTSLGVRDEHARRLEFIGIIGLVNGHSESAIEAELEDHAIKAIVRLFMDRLESAIAIAQVALTSRVEPPADDEWLTFATRLFALPDERTEL